VQILIPLGNAAIINMTITTEGHENKLAGLGASVFRDVAIIVFFVPPEQLLIIYIMASNSDNTSLSNAFSVSHKF
jgi:hypothetical protein